MISCVTTLSSELSNNLILDQFGFWSKRSKRSITLSVKELTDLAYKGFVKGRFVGTTCFDLTKPFDGAPKSILLKNN